MPAEQQQQQDAEQLQQLRALPGHATTADAIFVGSVQAWNALSVMPQPTRPVTLTCLDDLERA